LALLELLIEQSKYYYPKYLGQFDTNSIIIFRNVEICKKLIFSKSKNIVKDNPEYLGIFVEMNFSKLINYSINGHVLKWPRYYGTTMDVTHNCS
jgi:hypothetical protein